MVQAKKSPIDFSLNLNDSTSIKGIAIIFMLWHHLFYKYNDYGLFVQYSAIVGKVCVAVFLFLSGYGLAISYKNVVEISGRYAKHDLKFVGRRLLKFYSNYWFIFLIFVPLSVIFTQRTLVDVYGNHSIKWLFIDFLGFAYFKSFNITWWFNSLIVSLYLLFPIVYRMLKKSTVLSLLLFFGLLKFHKVEIPFIHDWIFHFAIGVACAMHIKLISEMLNRLFLFWAVFFTIAAIVLTVWVRLGGIPALSGTIVDGFLAFFVVLFFQLTIRNIKYASRGLHFLGIHSMNIYLIHTFIYHYWFKSFIYAGYYPFIIFLQLLCISLVISMILEFCKDKIYYIKIFTLIENKINSI